MPKHRYEDGYTDSQLWELGFSVVTVDTGDQPIEASDDSLDDLTLLKMAEVEVPEIPKDVAEAIRRSVQENDYR